MYNKTLILLMGKSGSGKTVLSHRLKNKYGWQDVDSYTTRPKRKENEEGHIFVSEEEFNQLDHTKLCAFTIFKGHRYGALIEQVDAADIYVIDPAGVNFFKTHYPCDKRTIISVYIDTPEEDLIAHMKQRGDKEKDIEARIQNDRVAFASAKDMADVILDGRKSLDELTQVLYQLGSQTISTATADNILSGKTAWGNDTGGETNER